jgi:hypothetical protein
MSEHKPPPFERIGEYQAVLDNLAWYASRRKMTNNVFVGLNSLFLTALAVLLTTAGMTWATAGIMTAGTLAILPINLTWFAGLRRYDYGVRPRLQYAQEIESEFLTRRGFPPDGLKIGLYRRLQKPGYAKSAHSRVELRLALYFIVLYPLVVLMVWVLAPLSQAHIIPPFTVYRRFRL